MLIIIVLFFGALHMGGDRFRRDKRLAHSIQIIPLVGIILSDAPRGVEQESENDGGSAFHSGDRLCARPRRQS